MLILAFVNMIVVVLNTSDKMKRKKKLKKLGIIREQRIRIIEVLAEIQRDQINSVGIKAPETKEEKEGRKLLLSSLEQ